MENWVENCFCGLSDSDLPPCQTDPNPCKGDLSPCKVTRFQTRQFSPFHKLLFPLILKFFHLQLIFLQQKKISIFTPSNPL